MGVWFIWNVVNFSLEFGEPGQLVMHLNFSGLLTEWGSQLESNSQATHISQATHSRKWMDSVCAGAL
ncbi:MAG: hypothetical protein RLY14_1471 [Planctomycetota bacterium]|jgi:hypothetical protein